MTHILIEGVDGSGKSTLAQALSDATGLEIQPSEGPEKHPGEINERVERYLEYGMDTIFDRHPVVSQAIYGQFSAGTHVLGKHVQAFYKTQPLIIYCRPNSVHACLKRITSRKDGDWDDEAFTQKVKDHFMMLWTSYDAWALKYAHMIYRISPNMDDFVQRVTFLRAGGYL